MATRTKAVIAGTVVAGAALAGITACGSSGSTPPAHNSAESQAVKALDSEPSFYCTPDLGEATNSDPGGGLTIQMNSDSGKPVTIRELTLTSYQGSYETGASKATTWHGNVTLPANGNNVTITANAPDFAGNDVNGGWYPASCSIYTYNNQP